MILIVGGAYQGKVEFARQLDPDAYVWANLHEWVKEMLQQGRIPRDEMEAAMRERQKTSDRLIITCNELGSGIVPMDQLEREWRETTGRLCCDLASQAEAVYRVNCGIGIQIK